MNPKQTNKRMFKKEITKSMYMIHDKMHEKHKFTKKLRINVDDCFYYYKK